MGGEPKYPSSACNSAIEHRMRSKFLPPSHHVTLSTIITKTWQKS